MIISEGLAKKLGLYENDSGMLMSVASGIGGQVTVMRTIIDEVQMGGATESFVPAIITSSMSNAFEGLIGMDFMANYSISIGPVGAVKIIESITPLFILIFGITFSNLFPDFFIHEKQQNMLKNILLIITTVIGLFVVRKYA